MANNIDYEVIRLFNKHASAEIIQSDFESYKCCYCNKIAFDIYSAICECKYCRVCIENKLELKSHKCDGLKTKECHEINLRSFDDVVKNGLADKQLMNKEVRCCFCEEYIIKLKNISRHLELCKNQLINKELSKGGNKFIQIKVEEYQRKIEEMDNKINEKNRVIEQYKANFVTLENNLNTIKSQNSLELINLKKLIEENVSNIESLVKTISLSNQLRYISNVYDGFQLKKRCRDSSISHILGENCFLWKIKNISAYGSTDGEVLSPEFYTEDLYKMKLQIYMNGDGVENKGYLSLYFYIGKGNYDNMLSWPYPSSLNFVLVNFSNENKNDKLTVKCNSQSQSFQRPLVGFNVGYGFAKSINYESLFPDYVENDTISIKFYPKA